MGKEINVSASHKDGISIISIEGYVTATTGAQIFNAYKCDDVSNSFKILLQFDKDFYHEQSH